MIKLSGLSTCLLYSVFYFNSVVIMSFAISQLLGIQTTAVLITQPTPISHFFLKLMFLVVLSKVFY